MGRFARRWKLGVVGLSGLLLASGCFGQGGSPSGPSLAARPQGGFGPVGPGGAIPPMGHGGPPGPVNLAGYNQLAEYQAADLSQKLAELQDENKSLLARLQGVQMLLEQRERAVLSSRGEVETATQEVARTRQEMTRCRQEIASLREHTRAAEKENQASLQSLVNVLESMLDRGSSADKTPAKEETPAKAAAKH
ncbi:MAG TPA: hypothetical protein VMF69_04780 [Gemmataceae bacterium]|nr:hypothetical protein [Gemmataceae bacterium]